MDEVSSEVESDTGLGLDAFLSAPEKQEGNIPEVDTSSDVETKEETPSPVETKSEEEVVADVKTEDVVSEIEPKVEKAEDEVTEKPSLDFESEENPYKKPLKDTRTWANSVNMENAQLKTEINQLKQQIEDPYAEQGDIVPSSEEIATQADYTGREKASLSIAVEKYGKEYIVENIDGQNSPFQKLRAENPLIDIRTNNSETPYLEAVNILKEEEFFSHYGRDPENIKSSIRKELESEIRKEVTKEFQEKLKAKEKLPTDIGEVRSASVEATKEETFKPTPMSDILN